MTSVALLLASALAAGAPAAPAGAGDPRVAALDRRVADLETRLEAAQVERDQAQQERERAVAQREQALGELAGIRQELAAARQRDEQAARAREQVQADMDRSAVGLRQAEAALATGSLAGVDDALGTAARAFADAHDRRGTALVQAARNALSQSDLAAARVAIAAAVRSMPQGY